MQNFSEEKMENIKRIMFVLGGLFAAGVGMFFSTKGFGFELPEFEWIGWGLGALCFVVQIAFSSQLAYKDYNYVIFLGGIMAYIYSGWSNYTGIHSISPGGNWMFHLLIGEFLDWIPEPLIVYGLIGVSATAQGDFLRNLLGIRPDDVRKMAPRNNSVKDTASQIAADRAMRDAEERKRKRLQEAAHQNPQDGQRRSFNNTPASQQRPGQHNSSTQFRSAPKPEPSYRSLAGRDAGMDLDDDDLIPESAFQLQRRRLEQ